MAARILEHARRQVLPCRARRPAAGQRETADAQPGHNRAVVQHHRSLNGVFAPNLVETFWLWRDVDGLSVGVATSALELHAMRAARDLPVGDGKGAGVDEPIVDVDLAVLEHAGGVDGDAPERRHHSLDSPARGPVDPYRLIQEVPVRTQLNGLKPGYYYVVAGRRGRKHLLPPQYLELVRAGGQEADARHFDGSERHVDAAVPQGFGGDDGVLCPESGKRELDSRRGPRRVDLQLHRGGAAGVASVQQDPGARRP